MSAPPGAAPLALLTGRTALVTGAASGIGAPIATAYAQAGARLALADRAPGPALDRVRASCAALGVDVVTVHADVSDEAEVERMFAGARSDLGPIDVLVATPGSSTSPTSPTCRPRCSTR